MNKNKERFKAPEGKTRVIGIDLWNQEDWLVGDYDTQEKAFAVVDNKNKKRGDSTDDVYYAYDSNGVYIRGNEAGNHAVSP